jgi:glycosyltransferase involved in cell wall biosynthesis
MSVVRIAHIFGFYNSLGGVESLLHFHQANDAKSDLQSSLIILFEPADKSHQNVHMLGLDPNDSIRTMRQRFAAIIQKLRPEVVIYQNPWGMPFLVDLDGAERRLLVQHGQIPNLDQSLSLRAPWLDGVVCIGNTVQNDVARFCPHIPLERLPIIAYPITSEWTVKPRATAENRPLVIGFCGRVSYEQKRVDRLPKFYETLTASQLDFRLEIIGDGPQKNFLQEKLGQHANIRIHGRLSGQKYWETLGNLGFILFTSDYGAFLWRYWKP